MPALTVAPAYGRDYLSKDDALKDWLEGKDFMIKTPGVGGRYINKADAETYEVSEIRIRYNKETKVVILNQVTKTKWEEA